MKWTRIQIKTITDAEDIIISTLYDIGLEGAQIEDKIPLTPLEKEQMFVDIMPQTESDDGIAYLSFFVEEDSDQDIDELVEQVKQELEDLKMFMDIGEGTITISETEDLDWINNWKQFFHQFYIDDILVVPSWEEIKEEDKDRMILHIDPGTAFGTGKHETTQLCIRQLRKYITPETVLLDVGTGSGAIAIALAKEESNMKVSASDISTDAVEVAKRNALNNEANVDFFIGDMLEPFIENKFQVDILVSNPPYIPDDEYVEDIVLDNEPHVALFGGSDGLHFYKIILENAHKVLKKKNIIAFEHSFSKGKEMHDLAKKYFPNGKIEQIKDLNGKDRMTIIINKED